MALTANPQQTNHEWVTIPACPNYWIGAQKHDPHGRNYDSQAFGDEPLRQISLPPFRISKYPVTVAQDQAFLADAADWDTQ